jgi:hypothetical protein
MDSAYNLQDCVLGFRRLRGSHTADNLAEVVADVLKEFSLTGHLLCITADNATVNDKLFKVLERDYFFGEWLRKDGQIRCMTHIINLAAQKILVNLKGEADLPEIVLAEDEGNIPVESSPSSVLKKIRRILSKIWASNLLLEALQRECLVMNLKSLKPLLDMRVRYIYSYIILQVLSE